MDSRTTIFLGSTYEDLKHHRQLVLTALAALKQEVEAMEYWEPSANTPLETSLQRVRESQIYIGIMGTRYGTIAKDGKSITQIEYETAEVAGLKRLVYLLDEEHHPIVYKYVDTGDSAEKLRTFKQTARKSVIGTFTSSQDLVAQVVTHLIRTLDGLGRNVRAGLMRHGIHELSVPAGFTFGLRERGLNVASILEMKEHDVARIVDPIVENTLAAAVITSALKKGNFKILDEFVTFEPVVYSVVVALLKTFGYEQDTFVHGIRNTHNAFSLRLLIKLAGDLVIESCIEPICERLMKGSVFHKEIQRHGMLVTPFNDVAIRALKKFPADNVLPMAKTCLEYVRVHKLWHQKQAFEKVIKFHERTIAPE